MYGLVGFLIFIILSLSGLIAYYLVKRDPKTKTKESENALGWTVSLTIFLIVLLFATLVNINTSIQKAKILSYQSGLNITPEEIFWDYSDAILWAKNSKKIPLVDKKVYSELNQ